MVTDLVENRALCELYPLKQNNCNEMASAYQQATDMLALQDYIDAQFGGPGKGFFRIVTSSAEARRVINQGKLAVVLGIEVSEVLDCGQFNGTPRCDTAQIDRELDKLYAARRPLDVPGAQVRQRARRHARSTAGPRASSSTRATSTPPASSGPRTTATTGDDDNTPTPIGNQEAQLMATLFGPVLTAPCSRASCRSIRPDRTATPRVSRPWAST